MTSEIMAMQYQCPECNKSFEKEHSLDQHMRATGHEFVDEEYSDEEYLKYENYDAINVNKTKDRFK